MTIKTGDKLPDATLHRMTEHGPEPVGREFWEGRTVALFGVPGAFTPTCSARHLPGYIEKADALKARGVDAIACVSVNDVFVMDAWGKQNETGDTVTMLADGNGAFAEATGLTMDGSAYGMGKRCQRYAMLVENGTVKSLFVEEPGEFRVSSADYLLERI